eukprot:g3273.t1
MRSLVSVLVLASTATAAVWPPPQAFSADGPQLPLHPAFAITSGSAANSARLNAAIARVSARLAPALAATAGTDTATGGGPAALRTLMVEVAAGASERLGLETKYDYELAVDAAEGTARATASSVYGAMYALETFEQLVDKSSGALSHSTIVVRDAPDYAWRGLMIDAGRRFVPMDTLENLLDTMAAVKLNVLHLHASDMCRFGVESKLYPNLTASLTGIHAGFYTQADIKALIAYAKDRGIRVVPEFDIPGHSRGFIPVESQGAQFCTDDATRSQLDGTDSTYKVLHAVLGEMAALFEDEVFNIGSDETNAKGVCTVKTSLDIERRVLTAVETEFGKTAEGWEEVLFDAGAATNKTIVNAWARHSAADITATGRRAVESKSGAFYSTAAAPGGAAGWKRCWYDISTGVPAAQRELLLGGEMSMWTDTYCFENQCGASGGGAPVGHALFDPAQDAAFAKSIGGMIWPRGYVGAAAFWNFNASVDPSAADFVQSIWKTNDALAARGALVCPTSCSCDQLSACGKPYVAPTPAPLPKEGAALALAPCALGGAGPAAAQQFDLGSDGVIRLAADTSLAVRHAAAQAYPMRLAKYGAGGPDFVFQRKNSSELVHAASGECLDVKSRAQVGSWACADHHDQPNQHWAVDAALRAIVSLSTYDAATGSGVDVDAAGATASKGVLQLVCPLRGPLFGDGAAVRPGIANGAPERVWWAAPGACVGALEARLRTALRAADRAALRRAVPAGVVATGLLAVDPVACRDAAGVRAVAAARAREEEEATLAALATARGAAQAALCGAPHRGAKLHAGELLGDLPQRHGVLVLYWVSTPAGAGHVRAAPAWRAVEGTTTKY